MTHLVPEQRVDKNGKITTRHVRPATQSASGASLPAPVIEAVLPSQTPKEAATEAWKALEAAGMKFSSVVIPNLTHLALEDRAMLDEVVERYTATADRSERALWQGAITFTNLNYKGEGHDGAEVYVDTYRTGLEFFGFLGRLMPYESGRTVDCYIKAATHLNLAVDLMPEGLDNQDPDAVKAMLLVIQVESRRTKLEWSLTEEPIVLDHKHDDVRYLAANMDRAEAVVEGLLEILATDSEAVESLWGTESSLRGGAL